HQLVARKFKKIYSVYQQNMDLINVGAYQQGSDPRIDEAIQFNPGLMDFLQQGMREPIRFNESLDQLKTLLPED
ncbi:MAG: flagellum-specific ATP synthase FliI, partial [Gammaproteobacteria bacterium]|nr:flagellum-specific ATP synthase FliI [Gammaproteobacteria bacterium]